MRTAFGFQNTIGNLLSKTTPSITILDTENVIRSPFESGHNNLASLWASEHIKNVQLG